MPPLNIYSNGTQPQITTAPRIAATTTTATTTTTTTQSSPDSRFRAQLPASLILRLRAPSATAGSRRIRWAEDVIDNEGLGRKKSKVCCIYHAPHEPGDSSDCSSSSSDSSSDSDMDSEYDDGRARRVGAVFGKRKNPRAQDQPGLPGHKHEHCDGENGCHDDGGGGGSSDKQTRAQRPRRKGRNAYERMPKRRDAR